MQYQIEHRSVQNRRHAQVLAGRRRARHSENTATNHRANTERDQAPGPERALEAFALEIRLRYQFIDILGLQQLAHYVMAQYSWTLLRNAQKRNLPANSKSRGFPALVIVPNAALPNEPFGSLSGGVFVTLNTSARNSRFILSLSLNVLPIIRSAF